MGCFIGDNGDFGYINSLDTGCFKLGLLVFIKQSSSTNFLSLLSEKEFPLVDRNDASGLSLIVY